MLSLALKRACRHLPIPASWYEGHAAPGTILSRDPWIIYTTISYPDPSAYVRSFAAHLHGQPELEVQIARDSQSAGRADFDVFLANRWLVRVRLRSRIPGLRHGGGVWRVRLPVSQDLDLMDVRCEATISQ
jgi:hypothetical protein